MASRRSFLKEGGHFCAGAVAASAVELSPSARSAENQKFFIFSLSGSENPTRANFPFVWAVALREMGHEVLIELAGDATVLIRTVVVKNVSAVGWPPISQMFDRVVELKIPIFV